MLQTLLPPRVKVPQDSRIPEDEVHLIMEYGLNEHWESLTAPVANRFITSYDESNSKLTMLDKFFEDLGPFSPDLVLMSGLHLLEGQSTTFVEEKIAHVKAGLDSIPKKIPVHLELASMANKQAVQLILNEVCFLEMKAFSAITDAVLTYWDKTYCFCPGYLVCLSMYWSLHLS